MASPDTVVELKVGVTPEAAVSGAVRLQTEGAAFLMFNAMRDTSRLSPHGGYYREDAGIAVIELVRCAITKFGAIELRSYPVLLFSFRPIEASPINLQRFMSGRGLQVLWSEMVWVWAPLLTIGLVGLVIRRKVRANRRLQPDIRDARG